jgi:hypothetical protein
VFSSSGNGSTLNVTISCCGNYSFCCTAYNSSSVAIGGQCLVKFVACAPVINASSAPGSTVCMGQQMTLTATGAGAGGTYTWSNLSVGPNTVVYPLGNTCYSVLGTNSISCTGMATVCVQGVGGPTMSVTGPNTACAGSSASYTASGASSYTWFTNPNVYTNTMQVMPISGFTQYTVAGVGSNGCVSMYTVSMFCDTTCAKVWPGDANSDGVVSNTDVLEIGISSGATGTARSPGGNTYTGQFANTWTGYGSTGKNKCHIDCNGDGTININDTVAIFNNFSLTHTFKTGQSSSANADLWLNGAASKQALIGGWNKVDIMLGTSANPLSQGYGVAFDVNYDGAAIDASSAYIVYTSSFFNAGNQNVIFRKPLTANNKIAAATVRQDGVNVNGNGKIGEFYFKCKSGLTPGSKFVISVSNITAKNKLGIDQTLTAGSETLTLSNSVVGLSSAQENVNVSYYPNPAANSLTLLSGTDVNVDFTIVDLTGRTVMTGQFSGKKTIDVSQLKAGVYLLNFTSGEGSSTGRLLINE